MKCELIHDHFQNYRSYGIPKAQLIIADIPYNISADFYASRPSWWKDGKIENGASCVAGKAAFNSDCAFNLAEYFHFCSRMLRKEPEKGEKDAPCMIVFCSFEQIYEVINQAQKHGFKHSIPLVFIKSYSPQVLKANVRIVGATEYALVLYHNKLPKFRNQGHAIKNWFEFKRDGKEIPRLHPTQKPVNLLKRLIEIFTDEGDIVIDPCAGSGATLRAARDLNRDAYGFERFFTVFHASQVEGIGEYTPPPVNEFEAHETAEEIISTSGATILYGRARAFYQPSTDSIHMPPKGDFISATGYYSTILHELTHWTGHSSRLKRDIYCGKHTTAYAREELVAEIGSMFISCAAKIPQNEEVFQNHASYVDGWLECIRNDSNAIFKAAADANRATDFILTKAGIKENAD